MRNVEELTTLFRQRGLKVTPQRQRIFQALSGNIHHPTAEKVFTAVRADMPTISLKTVYQTLHELEALGEIQQMKLGTGSSRYDPNMEHHHHLVCTRCGKATDIHADFANLAVPADQGCGFDVGSVEVTFRGLCEECSKSET